MVANEQTLQHAITCFQVLGRTKVHFSMIYFQIHDGQAETPQKISRNIREGSCRLFRVMRTEVSSLLIH